MSDQPLFQNADEQEAIYAPQQLPGTAAARQALDAEARASGGTNQGAVVGAVGSVVRADSVGTSTGISTGRAGTTEGAMPAIGATALDQETEKNDATDRRES